MNKKTILFVYDCDSNNPGDLNSSPLVNFNFSFSNNIVMGSKKFRELKEKEKFLKDIDYIIFGGGGLLTSSVKKMFIYAARHKKKNCKIISWGLGFNERKIMKIDYNLVSPHMKVIDLCGVRDYGYGYNYVPCSSCMNNLFDNIDRPTNEVVVYSHYGFPIPHKQYPEMCNSETSLSKIIKFLSSGKTIVTSAYHGAYWGMLLNRRVIVIPFASRFFGFKYSPIYKANKDWEEGLLMKKNENYENYLLECRSINKKYYKKIRKMIKGD